MKIILSQSGGYAGETIKLKEISTDKITVADKTAFDNLLKETNFFNMVQPANAKEIGADQLLYTLKISKSLKKEKEITFGESLSDHPVAKLIALVKRMEAKSS